MPEVFTPIQHKLRRVILLTCGLVLLLTCTALFVYEFLTYHNLARRELGALGRMLSVNSTAALAFEDPQAAQEVLQSLRSQRSLVEARLYDRKGRLFAHYPTTRTVDIRYIAQPPGEQYHFSGMSVEGYQPVMDGGRRTGTLYLRTDLRPVYERLALYLLLTLLISGVAVALAILYARRLQKTISVPILQLAGTARAISQEQDYSVRVEGRSDDEVGLLTDAFNGMLAQIEQQNAEIRSLNQNLEAKVAERTAQLEEANRTLRAQKDLTETIIDSSVDLIAVFDNEGRFVSVNRQCEVTFCRSRRQLLGRHIEEVFPALRGDRVAQHLQAAQRGEFRRDEAYRSPLSDHYFETFYIPLLNEAGQVDRVLLIGHDITGIMESNARLKELNTELAKSNRDLEQFAYIASHDLQEPLRKIQTFADLSMRNLQYPEIQQRYLEKIGSSARRMSSLIRDVLNYSRLSNGEDEHAEVDLNAILAHIRSDLELLIEEKGAVLTATQLPTVIGSSLQLSQLFLNLISNALKFSQEHPRVRVSALYPDEGQVAGVQGLEPGIRYVELLFEDNGIGFAQEFAGKIFSLFQRLHSGSEYAGTGVGLALCKKIVDNHGGAITVESQPGEGTRFHVYLPLPGIGDAQAYAASAATRPNGTGA